MPVTLDFEFAKQAEHQILKSRSASQSLLIMSESVASLQQRKTRLTKPSLLQPLNELVEMPKQISSADDLIRNEQPVELINLKQIVFDDEKELQQQTVRGPLEIFADEMQQLGYWQLLK